MSRRNRNQKAIGSQVSAPVATARQSTTREPRFTRTRAGERVCHSELIATINGSVGFTANKFVVNAGDATTFPWLSDIAQRYEQYRFHNIRFELLTRTGTGTVGSVILAPEYNAQHPDPSTEAIVTAYRGAVENVPWRDISCQLSTADMYALGPRKYVRSGAVPGDLKTYDSANFYVCTVEEADTTAIGKLWVHYDVELYVPQLENPIAGSTCFAMFNLSADQTLTTATEATLAFDEAVDNSLGVTNSSGTFTLPSGAYLITVEAGFTLGGVGAQSCVLSAQADSAALSPPVFSRWASDGSDTEQQLTLKAYVTSDGTTTFRARALATSSGTLTAGQDECRIVIQCV
jgi:hypothetical protein